ncbi:HD-GYP domain-containing protein [Simiduia aestuariiviva]|uniref:Putative nucleotidyltransferase with HDIG domain n=1 Tax=Simiduia aestuariiviva TaxID=1510459 RepID=A0A839UT80_9GAMM|nr:HD-GYP domain-containing protein [Simiduia aestuariiviva]MBB3168577.1 putative nucleotidyltransferase with HDIG domain [Simiduia aestuariiviva]
MTNPPLKSFSVKKLKTRKCYVEDLAIGMYVADVDCGWLNTPFMLQGFKLEFQQQIDELKKYCIYVHIEVQEDVVIPLELGPEDSALDRKDSAYKASLSAEEEHEQARAIYEQGRATTKSILEGAAKGHAIDLPSAKEAVNFCVESILRNPDALLWMSKIRDRDEYTAEHCLSVSILAIAFGRHLRLTEEELYTIGIAGLLHDVGKMRVPSAILNKPGKLTDKEFRAISTHVVHGRNLLQQTPEIPKEVIDAAHAHHERMDGAGYPRHLSGEDISDYAKIVSIVDCYDAITSNRCYSDARPITEAMKILYENRGKQFDESLTLEFIQFIGLYPPGSIVELENGMIGIVLAKNKGAQHLPKIIRVRDENKQPCPLKALDLTDIPRGTLDPGYFIKHIHTDGSFDVHIKDYRAGSMSF